MQTITQHLYLVPKEDMDPVTIGNDEYAMFDVVADDGTVLDTYDYLNFDKNVACDFKNGRLRICPAPFSWVFHPKALIYDDETKRVSCIEDPTVDSSGDME